MLRYYFKMRFHAKESKIVALFLLIYSSLAYFNPNILALTSWQSNPKFYLANYAGFFFWFAALFLILPLYAIYLQPNLHYFQNSNIIYRYKKIRTYWMVQVGISFLESILFVSFLYLLMLMRAIFFHQFFQYIQNGSFFIKSYILQVFAFTLFCILFIFWSNIFKKPILGFASAYLLFAYDYIAANVDFPQIYMICAISLRPEDLPIYGPVFIMVLTCIFAFTLLGFVVLKNQDQNQKVVFE